MSLAQSTAMRFPQPVRVGDLLGRDVLRPVESQDVLGHVREVVRDSQDQILVVIDFGGFFGFRSRPIAVPVDAMVLLGQDMEVVAFTPNQLGIFPYSCRRARPGFRTMRSSRWVSRSPRTNIRGGSGMKALAPDAPMSAVGAQNLLNRVSASGAEQTSIPHAHNAQFPTFRPLAVALGNAQRDGTAQPAHPKSLTARPPRSSLAVSVRRDALVPLTVAVRPAMG